MKQIFQFLNDRKRWLPLILSLTLMLGLWFNRGSLIYARLPTLFPTALYDLVLAAIALAVFACIFQETRCPSLLKAKVDRAFRQAGLKNGLGQYPSLFAVTEDLNRKGGKRYTIRNVGVDIPTMDLKVDSLQRQLGTIYEMLYSPRTDYTYLYVLPGKTLPPAIPQTAYDEDF